jgi:hypothetical protein
MFEKDENMWKCNKCGETIEDQFDSCWKCTEPDIKNNKNEAEEQIIEGINLKCQFCGHTKFWHRRAPLNTALATFFKFDWADASADCFVCDKCGYVHWFLLNN